MRWFWLFLIALTALNAAAPRDYVSLLDNKCNDFGSVIKCYSTYNITNPTTTPITIDTSNFKFKWRTLLNLTLRDQLGSVQNIKLERWNGASWVDLNLGGSVTLQAKTSYVVRISGEKLWIPTGGENEYRLEVVDNVLSAFGHDYTEYAWWNTSFGYKRQIVFNVTSNLNKNSTWIYTSNLSDLSSSGKLDINGTCFRIVNAIETAEMVYDYEPVDTSETNYTAFIFQNFTNGGNQTLYGYYDNITGGCLEGAGNPEQAWNKTGAEITLHFGFDKINGSNFYDSAGGDQNFSVVGTMTRVKTPMGYGVQRSANGNYLQGSGRKFNNLPEGSIVMWVNFTEVVHNEMVIRGNSSSYDLMFGMLFGGLSCSVDATANRATDPDAMVTNKWYMLACIWNSTGLMAYRDGVQKAINTAAGSKAGIPNDLLRTQLTVGQGIGFGNAFKGVMTEIQFYNRTLSPEELIILANSTYVFSNAEVVKPPDAIPVITIHEPQNKTYLIETPVVGLNTTANQIITSWWYRLNSTGANVTFTPNTTISGGYGNNFLEVWANNSNGTGYQTVYFNITKYFPTNSTSIYAYDEISNIPIYFNATFNNGTTTLPTLNNLSYSNLSSNLPQGVNTISIQNASYYPRIIIATLNVNPATYTAYLIPLNYASANYVRFHAQSQTLTPIEGATITFQKTIGGSLVTVGGCNTDSSGTCAQYLDSLGSYTITAVAAGYTSQSNAITPVGSDYTFTLSSSSQPSYSVDFANITLSFGPERLNLLQNWTIINWTVGSSDSQLTSWGLNISYGGVIIYNSSFTTPSGGVVLVNVSTVGRVGNLTASGFFQKAGRPFFYYTQKYYIYQNVSNSESGLSNIMNAWAAQGKSPFVTGFLIILVTGVTVGAVGSGLSVGIGLGVLTAFILFFISGFLIPIGGNHTEWGFIGLLILLGIAMMKLRSGQ